MAMTRVPELHGSDPAPAARAQDCQPLPGGETAPIDQSYPSGEVWDPEPGGLDIGEPHGHRERRRRRGQAFLGKRAVAVLKGRHCHHPAADQSGVDSLPDRGDHPRHLLAGHEGHGRGERIGLSAHEHVREPDAGRGHTDADLAGTGLRRIERDPVQHLDGLALGSNLPGTHQCLPPLPDPTLGTRDGFHPVIAPHPGT